MNGVGYTDNLTAASSGRNLTQVLGIFMNGAYLTKLSATFAVAAFLGVLIVKPDSGKLYAEKAASLKPVPQAISSQGCTPGEAILKGEFAPIDDVLSVSPLGGITAPGEALPAPAIRINTRKGETVFERRKTTALAPAKIEITAVERIASRDTSGTVNSVRWKVHFSPCQNYTLYFDDLDAITPNLLKSIGGLAAFEEIGGPDHLAINTSVRLKIGDIIGEADGFDVGLSDENSDGITAARPDRYAPTPYLHASAIHASPETLKAISVDVSKARCPLNYLPNSLSKAWTAKLGDAWGMRRAQGEDACRTAITDIPGTAQGAWFTDASHNGLTSKVSAIALAPDVIDPSRQIFALHGKLKSLKADFIGLNPMLKEEREAATKDFLTFESGGDNINTPFALVKGAKIACYQGLRANFVGPRINAVVLVQTFEENDATLMKIEARGDALSCDSLKTPWSFSGNETTFYR